MLIRSRIIRVVVFALAFVMMLASIPTTVYAQTDFKIGVATVTGSGLRLRESDNLSASILNHADIKEYVVVLDKVGDWYKVVYNNKQGYMHGDYLDFVDKENVELGYGEVCGDVVNVRSGPSLLRSTIMQLEEGEKVYIIGINEGWYKIIYDNTIGYMRSDYVELTEIPYENNASSKNPVFFRNGNLIVSSVDPALLNPVNDSENDSEDNRVEIEITEPESDVPKTDNAFGEKVVETAEKYLGVPYVWGGTTPSGFDCSGFVYYVFNQAGYSLSRSMPVQYNSGVSVDKEDLRPGDIVFFEGTYESGMSHVGIYVGDGQFIHAPSTGKNVSYADLNSSYYTAHYYGARRIEGWLTRSVL